MELPKIPDSLGTKLFYFPISIYTNDGELVKKEISGKYTTLKSIFKISYIQVFECEINQSDIQKMHENITKGKIEEYNPPIFLRIIKGKKYYPYIISIPSTDFTNNQKRIISIYYKYKLGNLIGFHPFTKDKNPPLFNDIEKNKKNCFAKFYQLLKNDIESEIFDSYFNKFFSIDEYKEGDKLDDFPFLLSFFDFVFKNFIIAPVSEEIILLFKNFSWDKKYNWEEDFPELKKHFYKDYISPLFFGSTDNFKKLYYNIDDESKNVIDMLFITYDFEVDHYKYYNDESLLSSYLTTLEKKQEFYELYFEFLIVNGYYRRDFKYREYLREEFKKKVLHKYLQYESDTMSWRKFDFAGEDKYDIYEGGGGCYFYKGYHVSSYSFRKTKKDQLLYLDYEVFNSKYYKPEKHFYLNKKIIHLPLDGIHSTFSFDDDNIIVTDGRSKPYIYNITKDKRNDDITFDIFCDRCYDAIMLENKLIVVSGYNMIGYYCQNDKNHNNIYKIIHTYKPKFEGEGKILIYLIEFNNNLLVSCYKNFEIEKKNKDKEKEEININEIYLCFHKMNYIEEEKKLKDENIIKAYTNIKLSERCGTFKNILAKFSDSILGIGWDTNIYLINIFDYTLVKTINKFENETFCSFYLGDLNMIFILTRKSKIVSTYHEDFRVYSTSKHSYRFNEENLDLVYEPLPRGKNELKCIIY